MFYYRYREKGKEWSDMLTETRERRCMDNLYEISECNDIEYEIYEANLISKGKLDLSEEGLYEEGE